MRKKLVYGVLALCVAGAAMAGEFVKKPRAIRGRYIVTFKYEGFVTVASAAPGLSMAAQALNLAAQHGGHTDQVWEHALKGFVFVGSEQAAQMLAKDERVLSVEEDARNTELFATQLGHFGLDRVDERDRPTNHHFTYNTTGAGVNIYVLDTGINADAEFGSRKIDAFTAITAASTGNPAYGDCNGHGTRVAKLAGGSTSGVAKDAKLHNVRIGSICACGGGDGGSWDKPYLMTMGACYLVDSDVISGMNWVAANRVKPAVANLSFGAVGSTAFDSALVGMYNAGVTVVTAAGNNNGDACGVSPARVAQSITVGASDINDAKAVWSATQASNTGTCVDIFAPGKDNGVLDGTSASAPIVAGAAALYLQTNTLASPATVTSHLLNNATSSRLSGIGSSPNRLLFVTPGGTETDNPPAGSFTCNCNGTKTCTFTTTSATDDFGVQRCEYLVDYDAWNRPITRWSCGVFSYTYKYVGPYVVQMSVRDDSNQSGSGGTQVCQ